jgi:hypothetical protein
VGGAGWVGREAGGAAQAPDADVADGVRGAQFTACGCLCQQPYGVLAGRLGVGQGSGQRIPARLGQDLLREFWEGAP